MDDRNKYDNLHERNPNPGRSSGEADAQPAPGENDLEIGDENPNGSDVFYPGFLTSQEKKTNAGTKTPRRRSFAARAVLFVGCALLFGLLAGIAFLALNYGAGRLFPETGTGISSSASGTQEITAIHSSTESKSAASSEENIGSDATIATVSTQKVITVTDVSGVVEAVMPSIVSVKNVGTQTVLDIFGRQQTQAFTALGSGIIIGENDAYVFLVTNNHVIENSTSLTVGFIDGTESAARLVGTDTRIDLAIVAVSKSDLTKDTLAAVKIAVLGNSDALKVGEPAIAIGNALGYGQSVTTGVISALDREITEGDITYTLLQTDAAINPGNSGGALLNMDGEVIGINQLKFASSEVEGMGYAIPVSDAIPVIRELLNGNNASA